MYMTIDLAITLWNVVEETFLHLNGLKKQNCQKPSQLSLYNSSIKIQTLLNKNAWPQQIYR